MSTTLVTCWFDLERRGCGRGKRDFKALGRPVFALPQDMVVFCDPEVAGQVREGRAQSPGRTNVVPLPFEDSPGYRRWGERIWQCELPLNREVRKDTPLFFAMGWGKPELLASVARTNPFGATHLAWIDLGIAHAVPEASIAALADLSLGDELHLHILRCINDLTSRPAFYYHVWCMVAAGFITGDLQACQQFAVDFAREAERRLACGKVSVDEDLIAYLVAQDPQKYRYSYGDYGQVLTNYQGVRAGLSHIAWMMMDARSRRQWQFNCMLGEEVLKSLQAGELEYQAAALEQVLQEHFIAAYWIDRAAAQRVQLRYWEEVAAHPDFHAAFQANEKQARSNFAFLEG